MSATTSSQVRGAHAAGPRRVRGIASWVGQLVAWIVILAVAGVLTVAVLIPRLGGATPYTIETGSMTPGMPPGTLVVVRHRPTTAIGVGDVITYQLRSGQPTVVTHRVVKVRVDASGRYSFVTKGDANNVVDAAPVRPVQVRGVRWYSVPYLGYANTLIGSSQRQIVTTVVVIGLFGYAGWMFLGAARDRRRRRDA